MRKLKLYLDTTVPNYVFAEHLKVKKDITVRLFNVSPEEVVEDDTEKY